MLRIEVNNNIIIIESVYIIDFLEAHDQPQIAAFCSNISIAINYLVPHYSLHGSYPTTNEDFVSETTHHITTK